ncbi:MAG: Aliphatic sulfonates import ATP-binding protein SsuB [Firmicutes bacterium]|nr:Aliphatic sulfonates import ATP-binding protein SsuB [Bacillota bacterium]MBT9158470.1 Aliphatic sulfonates import ATP-binding protein SsuB [Bacillota bacterium]
MEAVVTLNNVSLRYLAESGETPALDNISLQVKNGEFLGIVGPSGCGKSTLLSMVAGLLLPTTGSVTVCGEKVTGPEGGKSAYMLQEDCLLDWRTIEGNATLGLEIMGRLTGETRQRTNDLLKEYGLENFKHLYPRQLSGGMRQRVALVRTLATEPAICLLDEPFSALDYTSRLTLQDDVWAILRRAGVTCILVTHDIPEAIAMCDRIIVLTKRPGRIKLELNVDLNTDAPNPMKKRQAPDFRCYFSRIWEEMDLSVERASALPQQT